MSPVVRVSAAARPAATGLPRRVTLSLAELVLAARLAGEVPLPIGLAPAPGSDRLSDRLAGTPAQEARALLAREQARVDDDGPDGARAALVGRELLDDGGTLDVGVAAALHTLAGAPLSAVLDVSAARRAGEARLRSWFGVGPALAAGLSVGSSLEAELAWFDPQLWVTQLSRAVTVEPWVPVPAPTQLPDYVSLPSELLAGATKAHRDQRTDLLAPMAAAHTGQVRWGDARDLRDADTGEVLALLATLGGACRGRLRLLTTRRDQAAPRRGVTAWLLFDDGWHELRPGRRATSVLRRRDPRDLGLVTLPMVEAVA